MRSHRSMPAASAYAASSPRCRRTPPGRRARSGKRYLSFRWATKLSTSVVASAFGLMRVLRDRREAEREHPNRHRVFGGIVVVGATERREQRVEASSQGVELAGGEPER